MKLEKLKRVKEKLVKDYIESINNEANINKDKILKQLNKNIKENINE